METGFSFLPRQKSLFKGLTLKPKEQVEEFDLQSLASAAKSLV